MTLQTDFALYELKTDLKGLAAEIRDSKDVYSCVDLICRKYECPAVNNVQARYEAANRIKQEIDRDAWRTGTEPPESGTGNETGSGTGNGGHWEKIPATEHWPPRTIDRNMNGYDVMVLQAVLKARGWPVTVVDGSFGSYLEEVVKNFQSAYGLEADGIVGPKTWAKLLER